ncbi:rhodopsin-like [Clytia hemisphaerica]|uniref:rhodopsin-like n=1 Tax=Clytia hemisphaerica TaxID=252671 RepID=UPI0034D759E4
MVLEVTYEHIFLLVMVTLGTILNLLVIITLLFMITKGDHELRNVILMSLAVSDMLPALFGFSLELTSTDDIMFCKISAFAVTSSSLSSIMHMVLLMIERAYTIKYPYRAHIVLKRKSIMACFVSIAWIYGTVLGVCPLLGWGNYTHEGVSMKRCSIDINMNTWSVTTYNYSLLLLGYLIPIAASVACYVVIKKEYGKLSEKAVRYQGKSSLMTQHTMDIQRSFTLMFLVMLLAFLISWTPYALCIIYRLCHGTVSPFVLDISAYFGKSSIIFNPIIYTLIYKNFNKALRRVLSFHPCQDTARRRTQSNIINWNGITLTDEDIIKTV